METTESLNQKDIFLDIEEDYWCPITTNFSKFIPTKEKFQIFDPIRCLMTPLTPEENVRQNLIKHMINNLSYPQQLFAIEKSIGSLNITNTSIPRKLYKKRLDILVCYSSEKSSLEPLLLAECKATPIKKKALLQIIGYNRFISAPAITLCNEEKQITGIWNASNQCFIFKKGLPSFSKLLELKDFYAKHR